MCSSRRFICNRFRGHVIFNAIIVIAFFNLVIQLLFCPKENVTSGNLFKMHIGETGGKIYISEVMKQGPLRRNNLMDLNEAPMIPNINPILMQKPDNSLLDINTAHELLLKTIMYDDAFNGRNNLEKLLTAAKFIDHEHQIASMSTRKFAEYTHSSNFLGQRFLVENGMTPGDTMRKTIEMEARVVLTVNENLALRNVKPFVLNMSDLVISRRVIHKGKSLKPYQQFQNKITSKELYQKDDPVIDAVVQHLKHGKINSAKIHRHRWGSQMMLTVNFKNGAKALFKPQRHPKSQGTITNNFFFTDTERHVAEIAGFHLDRILGFRRVPPVVGRSLNITKDILPFLQKENMTMVFQSPSGNMCFTGRCRRYCTTKYAFCGNGDLLAGSLAQFVPETVLEHFKYPWIRHRIISDGKPLKRKPSKYCPNRGESVPENNRVLLLDMIDTAIFDFLIDNSDRFLIDYMYSNRTSSVCLDQGRGFGHAFMDTTLMLEPLRECCLIRHSTLNRLLHFERGSPKLSDVMRESLSHDLLAPVLLEEHLLALDRRVKIILREVYSCVQVHTSYRNVVVDDGHVS